MDKYYLKKRIILIALCILFAAVQPTVARDPYLAHHSFDNSAVFWFLQISDIHMGENLWGGTQDSDYLRWVCTEGWNAIKPAFMVATGDLTDSTNGGVIPAGPFQEEWDEYRSILDPAGMTPCRYFDLPGNHDHYNDPGSVFYLSNSVQGEFTHQLQHSWTLSYPFGKYHFVGMDTTSGDGMPWPVDNAALDEQELSFLVSELEIHQDAALAFVFGHHPISSLTRGKDQFLQVLRDNKVLFYGYGHSHDYAESFNGYLHLFLLNSLGKGSDKHLGIIAVDNNGLAYKGFKVNDFPYVLITTPVDTKLGGNNLYSYPISKNYHSNPIRALVFDKNAVSEVKFRVDSLNWIPMEQVSTPPRVYPMLWEGFLDCRELSIGEHKLTVQATGSATRQDQITFTIEVTACDDGIDNDNDGFTDWPEDADCDCPSDRTEEYISPTPTFFPSSTPTPTPAQTSTPTSTPTATMIFITPTPTPSSTSTPTFIPPTSTPTSTAIPSATPTPYPVKRPMILLAGYWDTRLTTSSAGILKLIALVAGEKISLVEIYYQGCPTGIFLYDDGAHDDFAAKDMVYGYIAPIGEGAPVGRFPLGILCYSSIGGNSNFWPYLAVED